MDKTLQTYVASGSPAAFQELVDRHLDAVFSHALRRVRDREVAADVLQTVFLILSQRAKSVPQNVALGASLHGVTKYACLAAQRAARHRRRHEREAATVKREVQATHEPAWENLTGHLDDAIAALGHVDRQAIVLRYLQGMDVQSVADELGVSEAAAKKRLTRAVDRLRQGLTRRGFAVTAAGLAVALAENVTQAATVGVRESVLSGVTHGASLNGRAEGTIQMMRWSQTSRLVASITVAVASVGALGWGANAAWPEPGPQAVPALPTPTPAVASAEQVMVDPELIGRWALAVPGKPLTVTISDTRLTHVIPGEEEVIVELTHCDATTTPRELDGVVRPGSTLRGQPSDQIGETMVMSYGFESDGRLLLAIAPPWAADRPISLRDNGGAKVIPLRRAAEDAPRP